MDRNVVIRKGRLSDLEDLVALLRDLFLIEADFTADAGVQRQGLLLMLEAGPDRRVVVAEADGQVVGMGTAQTLVSTAEGGPVGLVEDVVVQSGYRDLGLGRRLLQAIEQWARARGLRRLQLLADRTNVPALRFYDKTGWKTTQLICLRKR
jgi:GNAT superfamily N-acetyltransferase